MKKIAAILLVFVLAASMLLCTMAYADEGGTDLVITKSPQGETVDEGGEATFTAIAENYSQVQWRVVRPDQEVCWRNKEEIEADYGFPGVTVTTYFQNGKEYLVLSDIPASLDYYYIQAMFWDLSGENTKLTDTYSCLLRVKVNGELQTSEWDTTDPGLTANANAKDLETPVITLNPESVELESGKMTVISVAATASAGTEIHYQWYKNTEDSNQTGTAIPGATTPDYMPPENPGTVWYYCSVCSTAGTSTSAPAVSKTAAITYPSAQPEEPVGESAVNDDIEVEPTTRETEKDNTFMVALGAVIVAALGCGTAIFISMNKKQQKRGNEFTAPGSEAEDR